MSAASAELLFFEVGARVFAAPVEDALRVGSARALPAEALVVETALGVPASRARGIVVAGAGGAPEHTFVVDRVIGVRSVPDDAVQPLPAFAAACLASGAITGLVLVDGAPTLVVDLPTLVRERPGAAHPEPPTERC